MDIGAYIDWKGITQAEFGASVRRTQGQVSNWVRGVYLVPLELCPEIERVTKRRVTRQELRPDFDWGASKPRSVKRNTS